MPWPALVVALVFGVPAMPPVHATPVAQGEQLCPLPSGAIHTLRFTINQVREFPEIRILSMAWRARVLMHMWQTADGRGETWIDLDGDGVPDEHFAFKPALLANYPDPCDILARALTIPQQPRKVPARTEHRL